MGVLLAGGWSLPVFALEVLPEPIAIETDPAQLLPNESLVGIGAIAQSLSPEVTLPERFPPSVMSLENAVASLAAIPVAQETREVSQVSASAIVLADKASLVTEFPEEATVAPGDRFEPEFAQATNLEVPVYQLAQDHQEAQATPIVQTGKNLQDSEGLLGQGAEEAAPVAEEATQLEQQTEAVIDNSGESPAGDLLESVDGLEDSGIAGEGAIQEESIPAITDGDEAVEKPAPLSGSDEAEEVVEAETLESEEFDSEDFEAEDFEFDEDELEEAGPNSSETTTEAESAGDPELGILRLRERSLAKQKPPFTVPVFLVGNVGYIANGNTLAGIDPVNDRLFRSGLSLIASPRLSKRTALIASVQGNLNRYDELSRLDYNEVRLQTSLRHVFTPKVYGDVGWTHRQLFLQEDGDRFLYEHAAFTSLTRRDPLTKKTNLTSFYNLRVGFADPATSSRLRNTLGVSLRHDLTPAFQASLTGRMTLTNFTQQSRQDFYSQALAQLSYKVSKNVRLSVFGSLTRGNSSNRRVDFDNSTIGVSLSGNVKLF